MARNTNDQITRRGLLIKLGLATGAAYVAPTFAGMDVAKASTGSASSGASRASAPSRPSAPSRASAPSRPSAPSRASAPSRPYGDDRSANAFNWRWDASNMRWVRIEPNQ